MQLGYSFISSSASLSEGHSWSSTAQGLTLQAPENTLRQKGVGCQKQVTSRVVGHLQGPLQKESSLCWLMNVKVMSRNFALLPISHSFRSPGRTGHNYRTYARVSVYTCFYHWPKASWLADGESGALSPSSTPAWGSSPLRLTLGTGGEHNCKVILVWIIWRVVKYWSNPCLWYGYTPHNQIRPIVYGEHAGWLSPGHIPSRCIINVYGTNIKSTPIEAISETRPSWKKNTPIV